MDRALIATFGHDLETSTSTRSDDKDDSWTLRCPSVCLHCENAILPSTPVYPSERDAKTGRRQWYHLECARNSNGGELPPMPSCKHWKQKGSCLYGDKCRYAHTPELQGSEIKQRNLQRRAPGKRAKISNEARVAIFRRWLLNVYGAEFMNSGSGVLDVASGKGEMAFQLMNLNGIKSVAIDPRPLEVDKYALRFRYGMYHRGKAHQDINTVIPTCLDTHVLAVPQHIRMFLQPGMGSGLPSSLPESSREHMRMGLEGVVEGMISTSMRLARSVEWTRKGLQHGGHEEEGEREDVGEELSDLEQHVHSAPAPSASDMDAVHTSKGGQAWGVAQPYGRSARGRGTAVSAAEYEQALIQDPVTAREVIWHCSMVVSMHPDQAIEALVDFALCSGKLFAAIPCCVYAAEFPARRLSEGQQVRTYDDLLAYLVEKDRNRICVEELPFEGKNKVVFIRPLQTDDVVEHLGT